MKAFHFRFLTAATIVVGAVPAMAQTPPAAPAAAAPAASCEIDQNRPQALARATLSLTKANALMKGGDPTKDLKDVVALLNAPNFKNDNPVGRAFLLASAYVILLEQPSIQAVSPRAAVGIPTDPQGTIDLFAAADSAITIVENSSPACAAYMAPFRQQKAWLDVTNAAISALNANKLDSAEVYAKRSLTLERKSPYAYTVLASVAKARKNYPAMIEYSKQVVVTAGDDTTYADVKDRAQYELASTLSDRVKTAPAAEKKAMAKEAIAAWVPLTLSKDIIEGTVAVSNLENLYIAAGDSTQIGKIYAAMIAEPDKYNEGALLQAGVIASKFKRPDDAALLFDAVLKKNPYSRDALNNAAASLLQANQVDRAIPFIDKLVALDPNNPDNYMLYAFAYAGRLKNKVDAKTQKTYNDSLVYWNTKSEKMPVRVTFTEFSRNSEGTTLAGEIENRGTTAKTYEMSVDFLGSNGEVLFTETATVGPVAPKAKKEFRIKNPKTGVAGYRYKPLV
jgi:tetratricopeptide (TPR) repeat protein